MRELVSVRPYLWLSGSAQGSRAGGRGSISLLPLSLHVPMVRLSFFMVFMVFLITINLRSRLTILSNLNSVGRYRTHTLFVKRRARSSQCCGLSFTQVKHVKVCKELWWNPAVSYLFENQGHCKDLGFVCFFPSRRALVILKVSYVCQIICIAGDAQRQNKLWTRHLIASGSFIRVSLVSL